MNKEELLSALNLKAVHSGSCGGWGGWPIDEAGGTCDSVNPSNGEVIAKVHWPTTKNYEGIFKNAQATFGIYRAIPSG